MTQPAGALAGLRVFDLSRILAGPSATQVLGDLGAEVIKIERPLEGDDTRRWGPPFLQGSDGQPMAESAYYAAANRNKRSVAIDIASAEGQALALELIAHCDVLVENFKVGGLKRYGLDYPSLRVRFPRLVYCSITGYGQTGPYAARAGYDYLAQGQGGIMSLTGEPDGQPMKVGVAVADLMCGMYAATAILAALRHRDRKGEGQQIDLSLFDTQIAWLANQGSSYLVSGEVPPRLGNEHPSIVPYRVFATADGFIILAVGNDAQFRKWCAVAGATELAQDPRFVTNPARVAHRQELHALMEPLMRERQTEAWIAELEQVGVPSGPVNTLDRVFADPQVEARGMRVAIPQGNVAGGVVPVIASPIKMSATPPAYRCPPPTLGQDTRAVLQELLGLEASVIEGLRARGVVGVSD
ncbi:Crotonobetainyl-CoA:carnitine CoA-transferase CaiB [Arboricoccus pini]|uniref:Crotonobetainyl-CoA:carnitine CoA-transferase CaiB n=1 Tax=Arboricoccus pini TaxID=1963835 RepID=A0A212QSE9_9PROT|nr:CaiB/BaiF CoA-transferase family protein [Arboricoccus pini]SNB62349.1 Crotonobetainyl-CoA:carnitine CoA-transferase CaiB [Arboricoccus pini]